jgi:hypothetical protein
MRLEAVGLFKGGIWSKTNKILIQPPVSASTSDEDESSDDKKEVITATTDNDSTTNATYEFRYLPYLPLWWPELDIETGKGKRDSDLPYSPFEVRENDDGNNNEKQSDDEGLARIIIEQLPLHNDDTSDASSTK